MEQRGPRRFSAEDRAELWRRWRAGEPANEIAKALSRQRSSVRAVLVATGGIAPPVRRRRSCHLSLEEREEISRGLVAGASLRAIARHLRRSPSTVSREIARNSSVGGYRAVAADARAWAKAQRPKTYKLASHPRLCRLVSKKLRENWSPEQVAGWLARTHPDNRDLQVSHETIYRSSCKHGELSRRSSSGICAQSGCCADLKTHARQSAARS